MIKKTFKLFLILFLTIGFISCFNTNPSTKPKSEKRNEYNLEFYKSKYYTVEETTPTNPEYGGAPKIIFSDKIGELSYNTGDIMNIASFVIEGNTIIAKNNQFKSTIKLKIVDNNTLISLDDGKKYVYKKN